MSAAAERPCPSTFDVEAYAAALAAAAPPLTADQLDALGDILRTAPSTPPRSAKRQGGKRLELPHHKVDPKLPGNGVHEGQISGIHQFEHLEEDPVAETG